MSYSATDGEFTCAFHDIFLVFDSTAVNPHRMTGGRGHCVGRGRNDSLSLVGGVIDSLKVGGGRISFVFGSSFRFSGRIVSADSLDGTTTQESFYEQIGLIHLEGTWGAHLTASATATRVAAAPSFLTATTLSSTLINLAWTDNSDIELGFWIEQCVGDGCSDFYQVATTVANQTTHQVVVSSTAASYSYRVQAYNAVDTSAYSNVATANTFRPATPTNLTATTVADRQINLSWMDNATNETGYRIERCAGASCIHFLEVDTVGANVNTFENAGLVANTSYSYRVRAYNAAGTSAYSSTSSAMTPPGGLDLSIDWIHLTQATQTYGGSVPLVSGRKAYLRVFVRANQDNAATPKVRVRLYQNGWIVQTFSIPASSSSVPTVIDEGNLSLSWNVTIPASIMRTGLSIYADVDPDQAVTESDENNNSFPVSSSPMVLDIHNVPNFEVMFVPVLQQGSGALGDVSSSNANNFLSTANSVFPLATATATVHETYTFEGALSSDNADGSWGRLLSELDALRASEGSSQHYYGVVNVYGYISGMGYLDGSAAVGQDGYGRAATAAHEWGHNFGRLHVGCGGAANPDPNYPYQGGSIGAYGFDPDHLLLHSPAHTYDLMSYCSPWWVSDYTYTAVLNYRGTIGSQVAVGSSQRALLVWGRIGPEGLVLEPAFEITAPPSMPVRSGPYRLEALSASGKSIFALAFDGQQVDHREGEWHFAFVVPLPAIGPEITELHLHANGREAVRRRPMPAVISTLPNILSRVVGKQVHLEWDAAHHPAAMIRDATTGEVVSIARGGVAAFNSRSRDLDVLLSDGVGTVHRLVRVSR